MSKPSGGLGPLFAFLFPPESQARVQEEYQQALAEHQERETQKDTGNVKLGDMEGERWIN